LCFSLSYYWRCWWSSRGCRYNGDSHRIWRRWSCDVLTLIRLLDVPTPLTSSLKVDNLSTGNCVGRTIVRGIHDNCSRSRGILDRYTIWLFWIVAYID
jgi:hypothetical protein